MPRIGTNAEATAAVAQHFTGEKPLKFEHIGYSSRHSYRSLKSGVVYKFHADWDGGQCADEFDRVEFARRNPIPGVKVPHANLFTVEYGDSLYEVSAMSFIPQDDANMVMPHDLRRHINDEWRVGDLFNGNYHWHKNCWWIIDLGISLAH